MHPLTAALLTSVCLAGTLASQTLLHSTAAPPGASRFGEIVVVVGDVDGDLAPDLLVGDPDAGRAFVVSGATGAVLRTHTSATPGDRFGAACDGIEDVDLDGRADYVIGAPGATLAGVVGAVTAYSGATGAPLWSRTAASPDTLFGGSVAGGGDVNGDGWPDVIVGELFWGPPFAPPGRIHALSGRDGTTRFTIDGHNGIGQMGYRTAFLGDLDHDGADDLISSEPGFGQAGIYSGRTQAPLQVAPWLFGFFFWGSTLGPVGDVDADGTPDYAVGTTDFVGVLQIRSGTNGTLLHELFGSVPDAGFARAVCGVGDADQDGHDDFAIGTSDDATAGNAAGKVTIHSGATGAILATMLGAPGARFGAALAQVGDIDADGHRELAIGAPGAGRTSVYSLRMVGDPANVLYRIHGCPTSAGDLPRLRVAGTPVVGSAVHFALTGARPTTAAVLNLGIEWNLPLGVLAPGCIVHAYPLDLLPMGVDALGRASMTFGIPNNPTFAGILISWQGLVVDPAANRLGLATSNGAITQLGVAPRTRNLGTLGSGVLAQDAATGQGYLMFTEESVATRFAANPLSTASARNLVVVRYDVGLGGWVYDTNTSYVAFTPRPTDLLLARLDFSADTATLLLGSLSTVDGIRAGYTSGDLTVTPNQYAGSTNAGEFGVSGTFVTR